MLRMLRMLRKLKNVAQVRVDFVDTELLQDATRREMAQQKQN